MTGNVTAYYDMGLEIPEAAYRDLISSILDHDIVCLLINALNGSDILPVPLNPNNKFDLHVSFDKPEPGIELPPSADNPVDIRMDIGQVGFYGQEDLIQVRIIAGADVNYIDIGKMSLIRLNLKDQLYYSEVKVGSISIPNPPLLVAFLRDTLTQIPLLPLPSDNNTQEVYKIKDVDVKILDDLSAEENNALAALLTWGGGGPGNINSFNSIFINSNYPNKMALAIYYKWFCRVLKPILVDTLNIPEDSFSECALTHPVDINLYDEEITLTTFSISPGPNQDLLVNFAIEKVVEIAGIGILTATASATASVKFKVTAGVLQVDFEVIQTNVQIAASWVLYVTAVIVGIFTLGFIIGWIGVLIGAILGPLIVWICQEVLETTLGSIAESIAGNVNQLSDSLNIPLVGVNVFLADAFIDDITIISTITPIDTSPVRSEGDIILKLNDSFDLDSGRIGGREFLSADLQMILFRGVKLKTLCNSRIAITNFTSFEEITRYKLYRFHYNTPYEITEQMMKRGIFGYVTNDDRFGAMSINYLKEEGLLKIHYRTYENFNNPSLEIIGGFRCKMDYNGGFIPPIIGHLPTGATFDYSDMENKWVATYSLRTNTLGKFVAITNGLFPPLDYTWYVDNNKLDMKTGSILVKGVHVDYEVYDSIVLLKVPDNLYSKFEFIIEVSVRDQRGFVISSRGCVYYVPDCRIKKRIVPDIEAYTERYITVYGLCN